MIRLYYLKTPLLWDLLRGFLGLAVTLLPLILLDRILPAIIVILAAIAGLFVIFIVRTALRHKSEIAWSELTGVTLSYFSTSRSGSGNGVMTLKLSDGTTVIRIDSNLNSFDTVVKQVARVCSKVPVAVSPTTVHNFDALGAPIAGDDPPDAG